ncbi:MAG: hypothetical protein LBM02_02725 [Lachnospiraceae bacterium]|nr:hypothetical protein [Lachnospiraceae bacterium]
MKMRKLKSYFAMGLAVVTILGTMNIPSIGVNNIRNVKADALSDAKALAASSGKMQPVAAGTGDGLGNYVLPTQSEAMNGANVNIDETYAPFSDSSTTISKVTLNGQEIGNPSINGDIKGMPIPAGENYKVGFTLTKALVNMNKTTPGYLNVRVEVGFVGNDVSDNNSGQRTSSLFGTMTSEVGIQILDGSWKILTDGFPNAGEHTVKLTAIDPSSGNTKEISWALIGYDLDASEAIDMSQTNATFFKTPGSEAGVIQLSDGSYLASQSGTRVATDHDTDVNGMVGILAPNTSSFDYIYGFGCFNDESQTNLPGAYVDFEHDGYVTVGSETTLTDRTLSLAQYMGGNLRVVYGQGFLGATSMATVTTNYVDPKGNTVYPTTVDQGVPDHDFTPGVNPDIPGYIPSPTTDNGGQSDVPPSTFPGDNGNTPYDVVYIPVSAQPVLDGSQDTDSPNVLLGLDNVINNNKIDKDSIDVTNKTTDVVLPTSKYVADKNDSSKIYFTTAPDATFDLNQRNKGTENEVYVADVPFKLVTVIAVDSKTGETLAKINPGDINGLNGNTDKPVDVTTSSANQKDLDTGITWIPENVGKTSYPVGDDGVIRVPFDQGTLKARPILSGTEDNPVVLNLVEKPITDSSISSDTTFGDATGDVTIPNAPYYVDDKGVIYAPDTNGKDLNIKYDGSIGMIDVPFKPLEIKAVDTEGNLLPEINPGEMTGINTDNNSLINVTTPIASQTDSANNTWNPVNPSNFAYTVVDGVVYVPFDKVVEPVPSPTPKPNTPVVNNNTPSKKNIAPTTEIGGKVFPKTSDTSNLPLYGGLGAGAVILFAIALILKKRKSWNK